MGLWLTGKLGRAWHQCIGGVHGWCMVHGGLGVSINDVVYYL